MEVNLENLSNFCELENSAALAYIPERRFADRFKIIIILILEY